MIEGITPIIPVSVGIFIRNCTASSCELWTQKREEDGPLNGLWEFPGGKIEKGETPEIAMCREVLEETQYSLNIEKNYRQYKLYPYEYEDRKIHLYVYWIMNEEGPEHGRWLDLDYAKTPNWLDEVPEANHIVVSDIQDFMVEDGNREVLCNLF
jgi:8-oxo-dGTP diphosphatase